jgi:hypothetical protein
VTGHYSDGSTRDLSRLAVFETTAVGIINISADGEVTKQQPGELVVLVRYLSKQVPVQIAFVPARRVRVEGCAADESDRQDSLPAV